MTKQTIIDQIEVACSPDREGFIQVRMHKQIVDDDGSIAVSQNHRTAIEPGGDIGGTLKAVNAHLEQMGWPAVSDEDWQRVSAHAAVAWTPDVVKAHEARVEAARAAMEAEQAATT